MANIDGPKLAEILWERALMKVEGPDSGGGPLNPEDVWVQLKADLAEIGMELDIRAIGGGPTTWPTEVDGIPIDEVTRMASGAPPE